MANSPVVGYVPYFTKNGTTAASGYWIKGYQPGTTTPLSMSTAASGGTSLAKAEINASGYPQTSGGAIFAPHFGQSHDLWLFPTAAEADANDTTNATKVVSNGILVPGITETAKVFATVAAMKADASVIAGQTVRTLEHTSGYGYEGGNLYLARAATAGTDDNGALIKSTGNTDIEFVGLFPNGPNAAQFGADTTGTNDARTAVAAADAAGSFTFVGTTKLSSNITLTNIVDFAPGAVISPDTTSIILTFSAEQTEVRGEWFGIVGGGTSSDESTKLQHFLNSAAGRVAVLETDGNHNIQTALEIDSDTTLRLGRNTAIRRNANIDNMIRNKADGVTGGYTANTNIHIDGGLWDANATTYSATSCTAIAFGHANRLSVKNAQIIDVPAYHHIEINGCSDVEIAHNLFRDGASEAIDTNEAVQIDMNIDGTQFPWFGPQDSTPCQGVNIHDNVFTDCGTCIGTHSSSGAIRHNNIRIVNNAATGTYFAGVHALNWSDTKIIGNRFTEGYYGIYMLSAGTAACRSHIWDDNSFYDIGNTAKSGTASRAIFAQASSAGTHTIKDISVQGNTIVDMDTAGKSQLGISLNYCNNVTVNGNTLDNIQQSGISIFQCTIGTASGNTVVNSNAAGASSQGGISVSGSGSDVMVVGNNTDTMYLANNDKLMARQNIVRDSSGLTEVTLTNSSVAENLIAGVLT